MLEQDHVILCLCDIDIDECEESTIYCNQMCNNSDGGYFCTCNDGYQIDSDNRTCKGITVINYLWQGIVSILLQDFGLRRHKNSCLHAFIFISSRVCGHGECFRILIVDRVLLVYNNNYQ